MNYEDRERIAREMLKPFYARYSPPRGFGEQTQTEELRSIVRAVVRSMDTTLEPEGYRDRLARALDLVGDRQTTRAWPSQGEVVKAVREVNSGSRGDTDDDFIYDMVKRWWRQFRDPMPSTARIEHSERLVREGEATWEELKRAGFSIPEDEMRRICGPKRYADEVIEDASR